MAVGWDGDGEPCLAKGTALGSALRMCPMHTPCPGALTQPNGDAWPEGFILHIPACAGGVGSMFHSQCVGCREASQKNGAGTLREGLRFGVLLLHPRAWGIAATCMWDSSLI